ncbi:MAG TPA: NADP-dependent oxidoreductase [Bacteroidales bacterium]|nr:NADP-dependent oxidoreductase [Bacteroidales bacterium]
MKAILLQKNGGVENLILSEVTDPVLKPGEVMIQVKAIGINPIDATVRRDNQRMTAVLKPVEDQKEIILGWDVSGTIVETGNELHKWQGKDVFGMVNFPGQGKAYAELVAAPVSQLAEKPANIAHEEAAAASLAALTAWQALVSNAGVTKGDKVLIHAAAGGVGHYAVQIAKSFGAYVIGTASGANRDFVLGIGADEFIDYNKQRFEETITDADVVLDSIDDRNHLLRSIQALKSGGRLVSIKTNFDDEINRWFSEKKISPYRILVKSNGDDMRQIASLLADGRIKSHISAIFRFEELPKAHEQIESQRTRGKIVVKV